jgi:hypothetical protein
MIRGARSMPLVALAIMLGCPVLAAAQARDTLRVGESIRVRYERPFLQLSSDQTNVERILPVTVSGRLHGASPIDLVVASEGDTLTIPLSRISRVEVQRIRVPATGRGAKRGAIVGVGIGLGLYGIAAAGCGSLCNDHSEGLLAVWGGAALGTALGALIGSRQLTYRWTSISLEGITLP